MNIKEENNDKLLPGLSQKSLHGRPHCVLGNRFSGQWEYSWLLGLAVVGNTDTPGRENPNGYKETEEQQRVLTV